MYREKYLRYKNAGLQRADAAQDGVGRRNMWTTSSEALVGLPVSPDGTTQGPQGLLSFLSEL